MSDPRIAAALAPTQTEHGSSRIAELQRCRVGHALRYEQHIEPIKKAVYFDTGHFVHGCLRLVNEAVIEGREFPDWKAVIAFAREQREAKGETVAWDEKDPIDEAEMCVERYYATHGEHNGGWPEAAKLLHAELFLEDRELEATCRADLVIEMGGEIIIPDTKTRARGLPKERAEYARSLRTNEQFLRLSALAQTHFGLSEPPPVWLDAIIKTATRPKDPEAKWPVDRLLVQFTQQDVDRWRVNQARILDFEHSARHLPVIANYHECAPAIGDRCWAFDWCHGTDETKARKFRVRGEQEK